MIPDSSLAAIDLHAEDTAWKQSLANVVREPDELLRLLGMDNEAALISAARRAARHFPLRVPLAYVARMQRENPNDPLLRQVLPLAEELQRAPGFKSDAVGDLQAMVSPGLLHKYFGRALVIATGACAIHCRYCFRREFPYTTSDPKQDHWAAALEYVATNTDIHEIILSGGDPLTLTDASLSILLERCAAIPHIKRLRIHSRLPVVLPERVTSSLCATLTSTRLPVIHVIHSNHEQEIDAGVARAVSRLRDHAPLVLNQTVLLKGVNDNVAALAQLSESLLDIGVQPYYLHMLDRVNGTHHFEVNETTALALMQELRNLLPGYMLPRLVREIAGQPAKLPQDTIFHSSRRPLMQGRRR